MAPKRVSALEPLTLGSRIGYRCCWIVFRVVFTLLFRLRVGPTPELPAGPLLIAANHRSFLDPLLLGCTASRRVTYMMTSKYYDAPLLGWFFRMSRCIVVEEDGVNRQALREAVEVLRAGRCIGIFPEGHISPDGTMQPARPGLAFMARKSRAPVVPVFLGGTREALRKGSARLRPFKKVSVTFGEPISIDDYDAGREGQVAFVDDVMHAIASLGGVTPPRTSTDI